MRQCKSAKLLKKYYALAFSWTCSKQNVLPIALDQSNILQSENARAGVVKLLHTIRQFFRTWVEMHHTVGYFL